MSTHHDCKHGKAYWQDCEECKTAKLSNSAEMPGYVEEIPDGHKGFGRYKYRVIGRDGWPNHHTNSKEDAEWWLNECRKHWAKNDT